MQKLVGKKITPTSLEELAHYCKGEFQGYDEKSDEVSFELDDTNLPYLWSAEGIARLLRGVLKLQKGIPKINVKSSSYEIFVEKSVSSVRPFIAAFVAKGKKIDDYLLKQLVQLQEKFCEGYGRKRQKVSIGLYSYRKIKFPVHYKAVRPDSVKFIPLAFSEKLDLNEILEKHPKGRDYAGILKGFKNYPILVDDKQEVLSFPPIINSDFIGKVEVGDSDIFFEVTGTDEPSVLLAANIFAYAMADRGFELHSVKVKFPERAITTPMLLQETIKISKDSVKGLTGLDLKDSECKDLLERAGYDFSNYTVTIPAYRADIMHPFDIIEDIAIMYGFQNIPPAELESYNVGKPLQIVGFIDMIREIIIGVGYQEVMSPILSNKAALSAKMNISDSDIVEIDNYMSESFSAVRSWILPAMMEVLSKNKHVDFPQRIFEQGLVTVKRGIEINDYEKIAVVSSHSSVDYTEARQVVEHLMRQLGIKFSLKESDFSSFIPGRAAEVFAGSKSIGFLGEINPAVLEKWNLEMPVVAIELNVTALFEIGNKKS